MKDRPRREGVGERGSGEETRAPHHLLTTTMEKQRKRIPFAEKLAIAREEFDFGHILRRRRNEFPSERQTLYGDILDWTRDRFGTKDHRLAAAMIGEWAIEKRWDGTVPATAEPEGEETATTPGARLRIVVCRAGDSSLDVISVPEALAEQLGEENGTEGFLMRIYNPCQVDWWFAAPVKGIPYRVMEFGEDDDPEQFLYDHHDDERRFI